MNCSKTIVAALVLIAAVTHGCANSAEQQGPQQQKSFATPDEAVQELVSAIRANDKAALLTLFGPEATDLISSGDEVADQQRAQKFLRAYDEKHKLQADSASGS